MAIELENNINLEEELKQVENLEVQKEKEELESQPKADLTEFKMYINFIHTTIFNKFLKVHFEPEVIEELDSNLIRIIEKRIPSLGNKIEKIAPELAYLSTLSIGFMTASKNGSSQEKPEEKNEASYNVLDIPEVNNPHE